MRIAFCSSEVVPFAKTGGMADVCGTLPLALEQEGQEVVIVLPGYQSIDRTQFGFTKIRPDISQAFIGKNIAVYLIEHEGYYHRPGLYGDHEKDYSDNLARFHHYCRRTLELFKELKLKIDILHCHDWQSALIPVYLKEQMRHDPFFRQTKTVLSLHNLAYQGLFPAIDFSDLPFTKDVYQRIFEFYGKVNLLKAGILTSDAVATVSPQYAREIQTKEFGCGLEGVLKSRGESMIGILNGLNYEYWDPQKDALIKFNYTERDVQPKAKNKAYLQKKSQLPVHPQVPVLGFVSRLSHQKGIDLIQESFGDLMALDVQMVFLGIGEPKYHEFLLKAAKTYPQKVAVYLTFNEELAHEVYAGSDLFLMPSVFEPCGLSQMISLRYGTIPLVYRTGGLADTVIPYDQDGNGFVFTEYSKNGFVDMVKDAIRVFHCKEEFSKIVARAFQSLYSWDDSARQYIGLYRQCLVD